MKAIRAQRSTKRSLGVGRLAPLQALLVIAWFGIVGALVGSCSTLATASRRSDGTGAALEVYPKPTQATPTLRSRADAAIFPEFFRMAVSGPVIPCLSEGAIPQGLGYRADKQLLLMSAYFEGPTPSAVMAIDLVTGRLTQTLWLADVDRNPLHGHVGGVAVGPEHFWVASDTGVYRYSLRAADRAEDGELLAAEGFSATPVVASWATYADGVLWIGEFAYYGPSGGQYETDASHHLRAPDGTTHHALAVGYCVERRSGALRAEHPDYLLSLPDRVQGMAVVGLRLALSISYGRRNESTLEIYHNPLDGPPAREFVVGARAVPLWFFDRGNRESTIIAPPMMEGISPAGGRLYLLFESAAEKYRYTGRWSVDRLFSIDLRSPTGSAP